MAAAMNGIALHGGFIPYGGTFLAFADYSRPAIRLAALMGIRVIHVMTHDSIGLGEDGPTHQPVEHLARCGRFPICWCSGPATRSRPPRPGIARCATEPPVGAVSVTAGLAAFPDGRRRNRVARGAYVIIEPEGIATIT